MKYGWRNLLELTELLNGQHNAVLLLETFQGWVEHIREQKPKRAYIVMNVDVLELAEFHAIRIMHPLNQQTLTGVMLVLSRTLLIRERGEELIRLVMPTPDVVRVSIKRAQQRSQTKR